LINEGRFTKHVPRIEQSEARPGELRHGIRNTTVIGGCLDCKKLIVSPLRGNVIASIGLPNQASLTAAPTNRENRHESGS
jgi:hypothetical protein